MAILMSSFSNTFLIVSFAITYIIVTLINGLIISVTSLVLFSKNIDNIITSIKKKIKIIPYRIEI